MVDSVVKNAVQVKFFDKLKQSVPQNISLANEISDLLEISPDGAYRRMRGESIMSLDELAILCRHYKISPDIITCAEDNSATFFFHKMIKDEQGIKNYFAGILNDLQRINSCQNKHITYASGDLPLFMQFLSPEYSAFKVFFWQKAVLSLPSMEDKKFTVSDLDSGISEISKKISETYVQIPSTEIWHQDTIASNLNLIEFAWESGMFASKEDAILICKKLSDILSIIEKQAVKSSKFCNEDRWLENEGNFNMYQSEFVLMNNHILVSAGPVKSLYLTHNTFNSMSTTNATFCNETEEWLKNLIRKSTLISGVGEKQRHKFFRISQEKIASVINKISIS